MTLKTWFILYFCLFALSCLGALIAVVVQWWLTALGFAWAIFVWYQAMATAKRVLEMEEMTARAVELAKELEGKL